MKINRLLFGLVFLLIACSYTFAVALYEQSCEDGTKYLQCSDKKPGYMCVPSGSTLILENVIGQTYPADYPISSKASKPTENAVKCACENYDGYVQKDNECVSASSQSSNSQTTNNQANTSSSNSNTQTSQNQQNNTQNQQTTQNQNNNQQNVQQTKNNSLGSTNSNSNSKITNTQKQEQTQQESKDNTTTWIIIAVVALVVIVGGIIGVIAIALVAFMIYKKYKKGRL